MAKKFEYTDTPPLSDSEQAEFVLRVPPGIHSKADLLAALASAGRFPDHFGNNWDALQDCLHDLSWIGVRKVVIVHSDIPLQGTHSECRTYLEILQTALVVWSEAAKLDTETPPSERPYVEHELRVIFPISVRASVGRLMEEKARRVGSGVAGDSRDRSAGYGRAIMVT